jgi:hypothetical protein
METLIHYGNIDIDFPTETIGVFSIFRDLTELLGADYQSEAVDILKQELLKHIDLKPKPTIDFESDNTHIESRSAETIFRIAEIINDLTVPDLKVILSIEEKQALFQQLKIWKRPKAKKWIVGSIFSIRLKDDTFMFGQVIGTHLTKKSPTCAMFELRKATETITIEELQNSKIISVLNTDNEYISNGTFNILARFEPMAGMEHSPKGSYTGDAVLLSLGNAYYGLEPWNVYGWDTYFDENLLQGIERPKTVLILNKNDRNKYRLEHFGINENNEYVKK